MSPSLILEWLPGRYAVCGLDPAAAAGTPPAWLASSLGSHVSGLLCVTQTDRELSIVLDESLAADLSRHHAIKLENGFVALRVAGTLDFSLVGVLARLTTALTRAGVSVFAISTYQTDILLVRQSDAAAAFEALNNVCEIQPPPSGLATPI